MLAACSSEPQSNVSSAPDLESAAIERGLVRDPADTTMIGLYARDTDRVCIVPDGYGFRIGAFVDYGEGITCTGAGRVSRAGERLRVDLGSGCSFDAKFDGDRIGFPGSVPDACVKLCGGRASFAALAASRLSESGSEAASMRDGRGRLLCRAS
jgi:hypothetical protein